MSSGALVAAVLAAAVAVLLLVVLVPARVARARRSAVAAELARARADVEALSGRVAELAEELTETRRTAAADHEYVITSLSGARGGSTADAPHVDGLVAAELLSPRRPPRRPRLEDRLVDKVAGRAAGRSPGVLVDLLVRSLAVGHGVHRALRPDNLDRAAAECQVARRRSRRERRRELRDARRLLRDDARVRAMKGQDVA